MKTKRVSSCAPGRITIQFVYENKIKDVIELCVKAAIYVADLAIMSMENKVRVAQVRLHRLKKWKENCVCDHNCNQDYRLSLFSLSAKLKSIKVSGDSNPLRKGDNLCYLDVMFESAMHGTKKNGRDCYFKRLKQNWWLRLGNPVKTKIISSLRDDYFSNLT